MEYNLAKTVGQALTPLTPRQRTIIELRYGLKSEEPQTLAAIGNRYGVTRERIRQIEAQALRAVKAEFAKAEFNGFRKAIADYFSGHNGVRAHALVAADFRQNPNIVRCALEVSGAARFHGEDNERHAFWSMSDEGVRRASAFTATLVSSLKTKASQPAARPQDAVAYNYIAISKKFAESPHGEFGLAEWRTIVPKVSRDWAYIILKKMGKPLHFSEIAKRINALRKNKKTNPQTIHNELIKDKRFVLVGRGLYGLQEFNILPGTAREVLSHLLKKHGPLPAKDIVRLALVERPFKEKTLLINLQNKAWFKRLDEGKYFVRKA